MQMADGKERSWVFRKGYNRNDLVYVIRSNKMVK